MKTLTLRQTWILAAGILLGSSPVRAAGFPNEPQTPGTLLSGMNAEGQGRTAAIAYHNGILYTIPEAPASEPGSDFLIRSWDLNSGRGPGGWFPQELARFGVTTNPGLGHGYVQKGDFLYLGPLPTWIPGAPGQVVRATSDFGVNIINVNPDSSNNPAFFVGIDRVTAQGRNITGGIGNMFYPWVVGQDYTAYHESTSDLSWVHPPAGLARPGEPGDVEWDHMAWTNPGVLGRPTLLGDRLYFFSDQARTGAAAAVYDLDGIWRNDPNPALAYKPRLLGVLADPERRIGGYFPEPFGLDGRLYAVHPTEFSSTDQNLTVVDITDPSDMRYVNRVLLPNSSRSNYVQFQDEFAFASGYKIDMRALISGVGNPIVVNFNPYGKTRLDPLAGRLTQNPHPDMSQFALPLGNLLVTGGLSSSFRLGGGAQGMAIWAHQAAPDTRPPSVSYSNPGPNRTGYPTRAPLSFLIHETLNTSTIRVGDTFIVRPVGEVQSIDGNWGFMYNDILTFTPGNKTTNADGSVSWTYVPLRNNTTYEVIFRDIEDAVGNRMPEYRFLFSTGDSVTGAPAIADFSASPAPVVPGGNATLTVTATGAVDFQFDFGDGSLRTAWGPANAQVHLYAAAGRYTATAWARNGSGVVVSRLTQVLVANPPPAQLPRRSGTLALGANRLLWTVNPDNDTVAAINADADPLTRSFEVPVGRDPRNVAVAPDGRVWVTCFDSDEIHVLNGTNGSLIQTISTGRGSQPFSVVFHPTRAEAYVSLQGTGRLAQYNSSDFSLMGQTTLGPTPRALALSGDGARLYVTRFVSPRDQGEVWELSTSPLALTHTLVLPRFNEPDEGNSGSGVPNYLSSVLLTPDGAQAWVTSSKANTASAAIDEDNTVRNVVTLLDLVSRTVIDSIDMDNSDSASAAALSPAGDYLFVANQGNNEVMAFESSLFGTDNLGKFVGRFQTGLAPQGLLVDPVTRRTFVSNFMSRTVTALETAGLFDSGNASVPQSQVDSSGSERLTAQVLQGKRIFYNAADTRMSREGYISCATCHVDGGHDGRVWDFTRRGEGLRRTISLRGRGGVAQGRVHWSANFDEIQDFEHDIRNAFGGTGFMSNNEFNTGTRNRPLGDHKAGISPDLDALAAYVTSLNTTPLSPFRTAGGALTTSAQNGRAVFQRQNCAVCHAGNSFTDSPTALLHDVGTLKAASGQRLSGPLLGLDTPTLKGLWENASFLHDGTAATLADVLTAPNNARHGRMDQLTAQERNDLAAYLQQIDDGETQASPAPVLALGPLASAGDGRYVATATPGPLPLARVDFYVDGQFAGTAQLRADGVYAATVTLPAGWISLEARGTRQDGGLTLASTVNLRGLAVKPPELKEAYAYPNPAVGVDPMIRVFLGEVELVEITIFDQAGHAVHAARVTQSATVDGRTAFEYRWTGEKASGVYYAAIHGKKGGDTVRARAKFAVVR